MDQHLADRLAIRDVIETWAIARDSGDWETFRGTWHDDGYMMATWFQGPAGKFIEVSRDGWEHGVSILHFLGGCRITVTGERAIAQTKMTIMQRGAVHDVLCDVACTGRFYDFMERRDGRWAIVLRQPIYEKDRIDPVDPAAALTLDPGLLDAFPEGYRHLAYLQTQPGFAVKRDMPGLRGEAVERLYARGAAWLSGEPPAGPADAGPADAGPAEPAHTRPGHALMPTPPERPAQVPVEPSARLPAGLPPRLPAEPPAHVPVLIAGGGPVGLAAAMELSLHGVACAVIEPRPDVNWLRPRAKTVSARTMEHFRRWGLAQRLRKAAPLKVDWSSDVIFCTKLTGREITRFHDAFGLGLAQSDLVAEPGQQAPQPLVEQILREAVQTSEHAALITGWRVTAATPKAATPKAATPDADPPDADPPEADPPNSDTVEVTVQDANGRQRTVEADYVLGCDGVRSVIRDAIGARFDGSDDGRRNVNITFRAPELAARVPLDRAVQYWVLNPQQPGLMGRLDLDSLWWCIANGATPEIGAMHAARIVRAMTGSETPAEVLSTDAWNARMQLADHYARGRMFIAGDAAHQNPPFGGHGFNTGIGDAVNIAWKIAAVLNGWAPPALLETYEAERKPVALDTITEAGRNMATLATELADPKLMGTSEEFESVLPSVRTAIHRTKDREFHSLDLVLGYSYAASPITVRGPADGPPVGPAVSPGQRLPHRWIAAGDSLYDHLGTGFTLIRCDGPAGTHDDGGLIAAAGDAGVPLTVLDLDGPGWAEHFGAALVLVRPDQHVSWSGAAPDDPRELIRTAVGYGIPRNARCD